MTIAVCYRTTEGIVFGADSTSTVCGPLGLRHFNFAQKIFEIGMPSTLGIVTWGMGAFPNRSHRTLVAEFADKLRAQGPLPTVEAVAELWRTHFWAAYSADWGPILARVQELHANGQRTSDELDEYLGIQQSLSGGFCIGGNLMHAREPRAYEFTYSPLDTHPRPIDPLKLSDMRPGSNAGNKKRRSKQRRLVAKGPGTP